MAKRYFARKRKQEPSLYRIMFSIVAVLLVLYGVSYVYGRFQGRTAPQEVEASALTTLDQAKSLVAAGNTAEAERILEPLIKQGDQVIAPQAMLLRADLQLQAGKEDVALALLEQVHQKYGSSSEGPAAAAKYARLLEKRGQIPEAVAIFSNLHKTAPAPLRAEGALGLARHAVREQRTFEARTFFQQALADAKFNTSAWDEAAAGIGRINVEAIFSTQETPESKWYTVESGDSLTSIGIKLNTTQGLLTRANGIGEDAVLRTGQKLKYTPKDFHIVIERSTCRLFLMDKDGLFKLYRVGLGMPSHETALGKYTLGNKQKDPTWFKPGGSPVPPGDPNNELGTRWMPLVPVEEGLPTDLGIHGTIAPDTIGQYKSHGCPRMLNAEVEELYDLVVRSTPVVIVESLGDSFPRGVSQNVIAAANAA